MTHIPEVLEVMEGGDNAASKKMEKAFRVPYMLAIFVSIVFLLSLLISTFLFYKYLTCCDEGYIMTPSEAEIKGVTDLYVDKPKKYIRLPKSVTPELYRLKIIPYIWEGSVFIHLLTYLYN